MGASDPRLAGPFLAIRDAFQRGRKRREELLGVKWVNGNSGCYPIGWRQVAPE